jgi:hypothetical protein
MTVWTDNLQPVLLALRTIGTSLTFTRKGAVTSVTAGAPTFAASTTSTGTCVPVPPSLGKGSIPRAWQKRLEEASMAGAETMFLWVAASGMSFAPKSLDTVSINSRTWVVLGCDEYPPTIGTDVTALAYGVGVQQQ